MVGTRGGSDARHDPAHCVPTSPSIRRSSSRLRRRRSSEIRNRFNPKGLAPKSHRCLCHSRARPPPVRCAFDSHSRPMGRGKPHRGGQSSRPSRRPRPAPQRGTSRCRAPCTRRRRVGAGQPGGRVAGSRRSHRLGPTASSAACISPQHRASASVAALLESPLARNHRPERRRTVRRGEIVAVSRLRSCCLGGDPTLLIRPCISGHIARGGPRSAPPRSQPGCRELMGTKRPHSTGRVDA